MFQLLLLLRLLLFVSLFTLGAHGYALPTDSSTYRNCPSYDCGNGVTISYPFWEKSNVSAGDRYCGYEGFGLNCSAATREPILLLPQNSYYVKNISYSSTTGTVTLVDIDVIGQNCPRARHNISLETVPLYHTKSELNLTFYFNCSVLAPPPGGAYVECLGTYTTYQGQVKKSFVIETVNEVESYYWWNNCDDKVVVTVMENEIDLANLTGDFGVAMNSGFALDWGSKAQCARCEVTGGRCGGFNAANNSANLCLCPDGKITADVCSGGKGLGLVQKLFLAVGAALFVGIVSFIAVFIYHKRKAMKYSISSVVSKEVNKRSFGDRCAAFECCCHRKPWNHSSLLHGKGHRSIEAFIREYQPLASKRYNYSDIRKMTDSFKDKLGQGGYGHVYKGKLPDGRLVAVKVLSSAKGNGEEFINEVASISRTSHVNIVALIGFCFQGNKRALIYEFMPNGSLEKYIRSDHSSVSDHQLGLGAELLYKIAIGIAQGLGYLHRGCSTRILHLDIKPHNILLDEDFIPKISDFGLAKLCPPKESIVSMADARGTIGYIAPEVFSRNFGGVSHKSDVYSYGMMIMEMVGGKSNSNAGHLSHSSDVYFPHWVYKRLELGEDIASPSSMTAEEKETVKRMTIVGLWCIQTDPSLRPSMSKVIEMLQGGRGETLLIPPKPFLVSAASFSRSMSFTASDDEQIQL